MNKALINLLAITSTLIGLWLMWKMNILSILF